MSITSIFITRREEREGERERQNEDVLGKKERIYFVMDQFQLKNLFWKLIENSRIAETFLLPSEETECNLFSEAFSRVGTFLQTRSY